ncbi:MAG: M81 family metallopeptidase [Bacteroidota bacterium]
MKNADKHGDFPEFHYFVECYFHMIMTHQSTHLQPLYFLLFCLLAAVFSGCNDSPSKSYKVAVVRYSHETCTFCPGGDSGIEDWMKGGGIRQGEELLRAGSYIRGFVKRAEDYGDIDLIGVRSPMGVYGGSSRSWNTEESFDHFMGMILEDIEANMPMDGVYLALHGAMAVRNIPRPEAEIAKRIRALVGDDIPITSTFDLHGNEDGEFLQWADGAFVTKRYPHYDSYLQGERAAHHLRQAMKGEYKATTASRKPGIISATVVQWTGQSPAMDIMERARRWEARNAEVYVNVFFGFPWSDVPDVGTTIHVMTNDDQVLADSIADDMNEYIWRVREDFINRDYPMPDEAAYRTVEAINAGQTPVVLGNYSDRPGDATWILKELLARNVEGVLYSALRDERVLDSLVASEAQVGDPFEMRVAGFTGPQAGTPIPLNGRIKYIGPKWGYENVAAIELPGNNIVVIVPAYEQIIYPSELSFADIDPDDFNVIVVNSRVHFRRGFDETGYAKTIMVVDAPGPWFGTTRLDALDYQNVDLKSLYPYSEAGP